MQYPIINRKSRKRNRLQNYDYSQSGCYFVTVCTKNREKLFGEIKNNKMVLNKYGEIAKKYWTEIPKHFPNVILDKFIVIPNHFHGIIGIVGNNNYCSLHCQRNNNFVGNNNYCSLQNKFYVHHTTTQPLSPKNPFLANKVVLGCGDGMCVFCISFFDNQNI